MLHSTGSTKCGVKAGRRRRNEMMKAASAIHGGNEEDLKPSTIGMLETLEENAKKKM